MAFSQEEKKIILYMKEKGYSKEETLNEVKNYRESLKKPSKEDAPLVKENKKTDVWMSQKKDVWQVTPSVENNDKSFIRGLWWVATSWAKFLWDSAEYAKEGIFNFLWGSLSKAPELVGNTASSIVWIWKKSFEISPPWMLLSTLRPDDKDKIDEALWKLQEQFIEDWIETKQDLQKFFNTKDDSKMAKFWETATELWAIISPTPVGKWNLVLKWKKFLEGVKWGKIVKGIIEGATAGVKTEAIAEWEITSEWIEEGAFLWGAFSTFWATVNKIIPPKTRKNLEEKIIKNISPLLKVSKNKNLSTEQKKAVSAINTIKERNPTFKINNWDNALKETYEEIVKTKTSIFKEYDEILKKNNVKISWVELKKEIENIFDDDKFKTLLRNSFKTDEWKNTAFDILLKKVNNASSNRTLWELYEDTKFLNNQLSGLFNKTSSKDALESLINLEVLKKYNKVIAKTIWDLDNKKFTGLKSQYSSLKTFEDQISSNLKKYETKLKSQLHTYADAYLDSSLVTSLLSWNITWAGQAALTRTLRDKFTKNANPNTLIQNVFKAYDDISSLSKNPTKAKLMEKFEELWVGASALLTIDE